MKSLRQMEKENNRSAAGLRRSAIVERIRLREEWSELKGITDVPNNTKPCKPLSQSNSNRRNRVVMSDVIRGVVALVEVGAESRALALRAALTALGATVVPSWTTLVTHLVWSEGGCRATRAKARALASRLVSPLWVEACAASNRRLNEQAFPAAARASDLPSPRTLRRLLKRAEMENIPLVDLLLDNSNDEDKQKAPRLRISSDTDLNTSTERSADTSRDTSRETTNVSSRVNTAPRGARQMPVPTSQPVKSKRKLFTHREDPDVSTASGDTDEETSTKPKVMNPVKLTQRERRDLARAERMAKRLVASCKTRTTPNVLTQSNLQTRIVLTAMSRSERSIVFNAVKSLNGHIQKRVNRKTTHVLLGSYQDSSPNRSVNSRTNQTTCPSGIVSTSVINKSAISAKSTSSIVIPMCDKGCRTVNALEGAARGCRLLYAQWAIDSMVAKQWLHHYGYEVTHLKKIAQKARAERTALGHLRAEYAYNVFYGMRVRVTDNAEQIEGVKRLLTLCGAELIHNDVVTQNVGRTKHGVATQNGGRSQNGALTQNCGYSSTDYDLTVGIGEGDVRSKWVFDSVAAARMRTTRRYINSNVASSTIGIASTQATDR